MRCDSDPVFEEYIGQEVLCVEEKFDLRGVKFTEVSLAEKDTTIADFILKHAAKTVRVWLPNTMGTMDWDTNRINVYVEKNEDGKYVIERIAMG